MITKGIVDMDAVMAKVAKSREVNKLLRNQVKEKFKKAKNEVIKEFRESDITKELSAGSESSNVSATLGGYGNLYSYIGFYAGSNPIDAISNYLDNFNFDGKLIKKTHDRRGITASYLVKWFSIKTIEALSPMPWESGNSWVRGIEKGISGFSYYMYGEYMRSRSGKGQQAKAEVNNVSSFSVTRYLPTIIKSVGEKFK